LGIGPNPQSPIPNPQSPNSLYILNLTALKNAKLIHYKIRKKVKNFFINFSFQSYFIFY
jgi:hypothetical protein